MLKYITTYFNTHGKFRIYVSPQLIYPRVVNAKRIHLTDWCPLVLADFKRDKFCFFTVQQMGSNRLCIVLGLSKPL